MQKLHVYSIIQSSGTKSLIFPVSPDSMSVIALDHYSGHGLNSCNITSVRKMMRGTGMTVRWL